MAKKKRKQSENQLKNLKPAQKGEVRNPLGGKAHNGPKAQIKKLTREYLAELISTMTNGTSADLKKMAEDPTSTALEMALATAMVKFINKGDWIGLDNMLTRVVGKVKEEVKHTNNGGSFGATNVTIHMIPNGRTKEENKK